jgi:hypothetical protein
MRLSSVVFFLVVLVASGCAHGPLVREEPVGDVDADYPSHTSVQISERVAASVAPALSMAADGDIRIVSPRLNQNASFSLRARLRDSLTVVVRGPFGIEGGRGLVTPVAFEAVDRINRVLYRGPVSAADRYVPGAGSSERIARAALGLLVPEAEVRWTVTPANDLYTLRGRLAGGTVREYVVDPRLWRVVRVREFDAEGRAAGSQTFEAFDTVDGLVLPRRVVLEGDGTEITLEHRRLVLNPPDLRLRYARPEGYRLVEIE